VVEEATAGDARAIAPRVPPRLSRHEGYETAFMDLGPMDLTLESV
jgi:hypothetical protein